MFQSVCSLSEIPPGGRLPVVVEDVPVLLLRTGDEVFAIEDICTHDGQPLTDGPFVDGAIECPRHGARFDVRTGKPLCMPATQPVPVYRVKIEGDQVLVAPPGDSEAAREIPVAAAERAAPAPAGGATSAAPSAGEDAPPMVDDALAPSEEACLTALRQVVDPELMINIVDLGLIYNVNQQENDVFVDMTLTSPACPAGPQIIQQSKMALEKLRGVREAHIKLVMTPPWTPERMTDEARDQLGIF